MLRSTRMNPYQQTIDTVEKTYQTNSITGLSKEQAKQRLLKQGPNVLPKGRRPTWLSIFISQFQSPLIYILLVAAIIIFFVGEDKLDAFIISAVLFFNAIIGTIQEGRTSNILESLRRFVKTDSIVLRDGAKIIVQDQELVVGDVILLQEGQRVPADARIIISNNLQIDEAVLTGESEPIRKIIDALTQELPVADQRNMVFKGTYVMAGSAKAIVVETGIKTQIGTIHKTVEEISTEIPLKKELNRLSYIILLFILVMCSALFIIGLFTGKPLQELLVMLTALFICVVPEGLPVVLTLVLVSGAYRMAKKNVLIKNLQSVETLGRTDAIVIDKTGTLTRNEMIVSTVYADKTMWRITGQGYHAAGQIYQDGKKIDTFDPKSNIIRMATAASLLNNAEITFISELNLFDIKGDPTEAALFVFSQKLGLHLEHLVHDYKKIYEIPFDSVLKYHAGFFDHADGPITFIIGSPEAIINRCPSITENEQQQLNQLLDAGLRIVAFGWKKLTPEKMPPTDLSPEEQLQHFKQLLNDDMQFLGFCGIQDSIRPEVNTIIKQARVAGLQVIMATGDHHKTAIYVAKQVGIYRPGDESITGTEFDQLSDEQLCKRLKKITVYARVSPEQKLRIIRLFNQIDNIVAMTGDGINDAPSLVAADLGIAMGRIGTEVAKQASDIILLDDSFENIISAIKQGRHIFYTLRRVVLYFFATNMGEILIVLFALIVNLPLPITAAQILWLNLVTDGFLDIALSMEPQEKKLLGVDSTIHKLKLVDTNLLLKMLFISIPMGLTSLFIFSYYYQYDIVYARTMTLITMAMFQWFNAWNCRSETKSIFQLGFFTNKWLILATSFVFLLQLALLHVPFMQKIFKTMPLSIADWAIVIAISLPIIFIEEIRKSVVRWRNPILNN